MLFPYGALREGKCPFDHTPTQKTTKMKRPKHLKSRTYTLPTTGAGSSNESSRCVVYAIELDPSVAMEPAFAAKNPRRLPGKACFYVGMTMLRPEDRFAQHVSGSKNVSRIAHEYGQKLRMDVVGNNKPTRRTWALEREDRVANRLRSQGFGAWKG